MSKDKFYKKNAPENENNAPEDGNNEINNEENNAEGTENAEVAEKPDGEVAETGEAEYGEVAEIGEENEEDGASEAAENAEEGEARGEDYDRSDGTARNVGDNASDDEDYEGFAQRINGARHSRVVTAAPIRVRTEEMSKNLVQLSAEAAQKNGGRKLFNGIVGAVAAFAVLLVGIIAAYNIIAPERKKQDDTLPSDEIEAPTVEASTVEASEDESTPETHEKTDDGAEQTDSNAAGEIGETPTSENVADTGETEPSADVPTADVPISDVPAADNTQETPTASEQPEQPEQADTQPEQQYEAQWEPEEEPYVEPEPEPQKYWVHVAFYDRDPIDVYTEPEMLFNILAQKGIYLTENEVPTYDQYTTINEDMSIWVDKYEYGTETVTEEIPYGSIVHEIDTIPRGEVNYISSGETGLRNATYTVEYKNGAEISRTFSYEEVTKSPVDEEYEIGVGGTLVGIDGITYTYSYRRTVPATYYNLEGLTYVGTYADESVIATDMDYIPMGTRVYVKNDRYDFGARVASDIGGQVDNWEIDIWLSDSNPYLPAFRQEGYVYDMEIYYLD